MSGVVDRPLVVVVGVSWPLMVGVGASLPEVQRGWFAGGLSAAFGLVVGLGRVVQGFVGSLAGDVPFVAGFVGLSPVLVGLVVASLLLAVGAKPAARWVFRDAPNADG